MATGGCGRSGGRALAQRSASTETPAPPLCLDRQDESRVRSLSIGVLMYLHIFVYVISLLHSTYILKTIV